MSSSWLEVRARREGRDLHNFAAFLARVRDGRVTHLLDGRGAAVLQRRALVLNAGSRRRHATVTATRCTRLLPMPW